MQKYPNHQPYICKRIHQNITSMRENHSTYKYLATSIEVIDMTLISLSSGFAIFGQ